MQNPDDDINPDISDRNPANVAFTSVYNNSKLYIKIPKIAPIIGVKATNIDLKIIILLLIFFHIYIKHFHPQHTPQ